MREEGKKGFFFQWSFYLPGRRSDEVAVGRREVQREVRVRVRAARASGRGRGA